MVTEFGKKLRLLRMNKGELLKHMAVRLGVSSAFLSAIELGDKGIPKGFLEKVIQIYDIPQEEVDEWQDAVEQSAQQVKMNLASVSLAKRQAALVFSRNFDGMSDEDARIILSFFKKEEDQ